ncbi:MAG: hypothetical protein RL022_185 [Chloroflexota bacterium]
MTPPLDAIAVAAPGPTVPASRMQSLLMAHSVLAGPEVRLMGPTGGGEAVLTHICAGTGAFHASIWVVGSPGEAPRLQVGHGSLGARRVPTRGIGLACTEARTVVRAKPVPGGAGREGSSDSWVLIPLAGTRGSVLGALCVSRNVEHGDWLADEVLLLEALASHLAVHLENGQLHDQLVRALDEVLTLYGAGEAISSSLDLDNVLSGILDISRRLTQADACYITENPVGGAGVVLASQGGSEYWDRVRSSQTVVEVHDQVREDGIARPFRALGAVGWCIGLKVRGQVIGSLEVYALPETSGREVQPLPDGHGWAVEPHLLSGLAMQAAIALENAKLYQAVREKEAHLQRLVERMIGAQEEDRRRVAYDIHDGLAQLMVSAHQHLQTFGIYYQQGDERAGPSLQKGLFMLQKSIEEVRKVIAGLRPSELDDFGLMAALQLTVQNLRDEFGWQVEIVDGLDGGRLPAAVEVTAYRIIQEALNNARRHGEARRAKVAVVRRNGEVELQVRDWGRGFDVRSLSERAGTGSDAGHRVGVHGMRERAHLLGGTFHIDSAPEDGTTVTVVIPVDRSTDGLMLGGADGFGGMVRVGEAPASAGGAVVTGARSRGGGVLSWPGQRKAGGGSIGNWAGASDPDVNAAGSPVIREDGG